MTIRPAPRIALAVAVVFTTLVVMTAPATASSHTVNLGNATSFAVLGGSTVTNTGPTTVSGDLGVSPGSAVTGFPPGTVSNGAIHAADALAAQAQASASTAYDDIASRASTAAIVGDLAGQTFVAGVYDGGAIGLTGTVTLNGQGNADAVFIFRASSTLTTAAASAVSLTNGAQACNVFWKVDSSATLGTNSVFNGTILALTNIAAGTGATINGRLLARTAAVNLDDNTITRPFCTAPAPPPTSTTSTSTTSTSTTSTTAAPATTSTTASVTSTTVADGTSGPVVPGPTSSTTPSGGVTALGAGGASSTGGSGAPELPRTGRELNAIATGGLVAILLGGLVLRASRPVHAPQHLRPKKR